MVPGIYVFPFGLLVHFVHPARGTCLASLFYGEPSPVRPTRAAAVSKVQWLSSIPDWSGCTWYQIQLAPTTCLLCLILAFRCYVAVMHSYLYDTAALTARYLLRADTIAYCS